MKISDLEELMCQSNTVATRAYQSWRSCFRTKCVVGVVGHRDTRNKIEVEPRPTKGFDQAQDHRFHRGTSTTDARGKTMCTVNAGLGAGRCYHTDTSCPHSGISRVELSFCGKRHVSSIRGKLVDHGGGVYRTRLWFRPCFTLSG